MITTIYSDPDFLEHHGVKGMKWGVRRYQNYDGTRINPSGSKSLKRKKVDPIYNFKSNVRVLTGKTKKKDRIPLKEQRVFGGKGRTFAELESGKDKHTLDEYATSDVVKNSLSKEDRAELTKLGREVIKAHKESQSEFDKEFEYEADYQSRAIDWAIDDLKKNYPDVWDDVQQDAKNEGFDVRDHKVVRYTADEFPEPYNPPKTSYDEKFDKYYDAITRYSDSLIKMYGEQNIDILDRNLVVDELMKQSGWTEYLETEVWRTK